MKWLIGLFFSMLVVVQADIVYPGRADTSDRLTIYGKMVECPDGSLDRIVTRIANDWAFEPILTPLPDFFISSKEKAIIYKDRWEINQVTTTGTRVAVSYKISSNRSPEAISIVAPGAHVDGQEVSAAYSGIVQVSLVSPSFTAVRPFRAMLKEERVYLRLNFDPLTVAHKQQTEIMSLIADITPEGDDVINIYTPYSPEITTNIIAQGDITRNTNCWLSSVDTTGFAVWNTTERNRRAAVAISPRHALCVTHFDIFVGAKIFFLANDNTLISRTVIQSTILDGLGVADTTLLLLDSDLPSSIAIVSVLPTNWRSYWPTGLEGVVVAAINQFGHAKLKNGPTIGTMVLYVDGLSPLDPRWEMFLIDKDSGSPIFMVVNSKPVLISMATGTLHGTELSANISRINQAMYAQLPDMYQLTSLNLSNFKKFDLGR